MLRVTRDNWGFTLIHLDSAGVELYRIDFSYAEGGVLLEQLETELELQKLHVRDFHERCDCGHARGVHSATGCSICPCDLFNPLQAP
jgi:predicted alpha-1,6-mannanase (GH76 family)